MTKAKKPAAGRGKARKLKLRKETLKDLDAKNKSRALRGGVGGLQIPKSITGECCFTGKTVGCPIR